MRDYSLDMSLLPATLKLVRNYYNGYRFLSLAPDSLYNSTILTYFLKAFSIDREYPSDMIDPNVKTDVSWIKRLSSNAEAPLRLMEELLHNDGMPYDAKSLSDKFNMERFFEQDHYPASLFFLGMLSIKSDHTLGFPNQTLTSIFADYYTTLARVIVTKGYNSYFERFQSDLDLGALFGGYVKVYLGQMPAQAFDKVNENFVRSTFFELCTRYLPRHFSFAIEAQRHSGRSDFEMLGRPEGMYKNQMWLVEFKYYPNSSKITPESLIEAPDDVVRQVQQYKVDVLAEFPHYTVKTAVCAVVGNQGYKWFDLG
jgi:hypothetical protein